MRLTTFLATGAVVAASLVTATPATASNPSPASCVGKVEGVTVPGGSGDLAATAVVVVVTGQVQCNRTLPPTDTTPWAGQLTIDVATVATGSVVCGAGPLRHNAVGPVLAMEIHHHCTIPISDPRHDEPLNTRLYWATLYPYQCCGWAGARIDPVGIS